MQVWFLSWRNLSSAAAQRQIIDNFVNQETQQRPGDSSLFAFVIRNTLNQHSFVVSRSGAIAWRLHCMEGVCGGSLSSTAIAVTNRWFT
jgi:hypothetical protein